MLTRLSTFLLMAAVVLAVGAITSYRIPPSEQYNDRTEYNREYTEIAFRSQPNDDTNATQQHKPDAEERLMDWLADIRLTDILIVIFTGVLASKTSGLYDETAALRVLADQQREDTLRSIAAAEKSAAAAEKSVSVAADALRLSIAPLIIINEIDLIDYPNCKATEAAIRFVLKNTGNGPGIINKIAVFITTVDRGVTPPAPVVSKIEQNAYTLIEVGGEMPTFGVKNGSINRDVINQIHAGIVVLHVGIQILSQDMIKNKNDQLFLFVYRTDINGFRRDDTIENHANPDGR